MRRTARTLAAAALSVALHGGAVAALLAGREETAEIAGGATAIALVGDATVDAIAAGTAMPVLEPVDPTETSPEAVPTVMETTQPVEMPPVQTAMAAPAEPVPVQPAISVTQPAAIAPVEPTVQPEPTKATEQVQTAYAATREPTEALAPASPVKAVEAATAAEVQASETVAALEAVPLPSARPVEPTKAAEPVRVAAVDPAPELPRREPLKPQVQPAKKKKPEQAKKKPAPQAPGNGGQSQAEARKGTAAGRTEGEQAEAGESRGKAMREGNASASNYPGKVVSKLRRSLRYPAEAKRQKIRGEVHVAFTVSSGGGVSGVRVVRSSGSPVLDRAALDTVQRAAPFPPIPDGRANWPFTVPLAFSR